MNRMRTFSLQHRLKMMRQYKVKQRYVNKLLESLQATSPEVQLENVSFWKTRLIDFFEISGRKSTCCSRDS